MSRPVSDGFGVLVGVVDLVATPDAARRGRQVLSSYLARQEGLDDERVEIRGLLLSEVVTNAVEHAGMSGHSRVRVLWVRTSDILRTEVYDPDPRLPTVGAAAVDDEAGRGLWLVEALADRWATEPVPPGEALCPGGGKVVWFAVRGVWTTPAQPDR